MYRCAEQIDIGLVVQDSSGAGKQKSEYALLHHQNLKSASRAHCVLVFELAALVGPLVAPVEFAISARVYSFSEVYGHRVAQFCVQTTYEERREHRAELHFKCGELPGYHAATSIQEDK